MRTSILTLLYVLATAAIMSARPALTQQPDLSTCQYERDQQAAIAACTRVVADGALPAPVRSAALVRRALIYSALSGRDFITALEIDPASTTVRKARAHHLFATGRYDQAIRDYNEAIRLDPNDAEAYHGRGDAGLMQKNYSAAIADYRKAIELKPSDPSMAWQQCRISASWTYSFFNCVLAADDATLPPERRAEAQRRLDGITGGGGTAR